MQADLEISDGEIVDDTEDAEDTDIKKSLVNIKFSAEKLQKNFRRSNQNESGEEEAAASNSLIEKQQSNKSCRDDRKVRHIAKKRRFDYGRKMNNDRHRQFRPNHRDHNAFRRNNQRDHQFMNKNKPPKTLKYTIALPIISYAENPRHESKNNKTSNVKISPEKSPLHKVLEKELEESKATEKVTFTPPIIDNDKTEDLDSNIQVESQNELNSSQKESIPVVIESPPRSPVLQLPSSSSDSGTLFREKGIRNVCSFLSDIESEGYLSSFSILNDLISDDEGENESEIKNDSVNIEEAVVEQEEDDTTSNSSSGSSTTSDSDSSSSSESEDLSFDEEESSNEDEETVTPFSSGFGRFSSTDVTASTITKTIEMQEKISESSIKKPPLFTSSPCIQPSQIALKTGLLPHNFAVPFKIYSIRDFSANQFSFPIVSAPQVSVVKASPKEVKNDKEHKEEVRTRKSRSRSLERRRSVDRDGRNRRRRSPLLKRKSVSPSSSAKRRSLTPPSSHKSRSSHSRHSSPPPSPASRSRMRVSHAITSGSSSRKSLHRPRSKERIRKRSHSPQIENSRSSRQKRRTSRDSERASKRDEITPYRYERTNSPYIEGETGNFTDEEDSQTDFRRHEKINKLDSSEMSHSTNDDYNSTAFYYSQYYQDQDEYFMPLDQYYNDDFYSTSKNFINNYNLVDIMQQKRENNQVAVQVGNVLEIVPNADILQPEANEAISIDPKVLKEKRKIARDRKRKLKKKRKEQLRKEIQQYFDEGIHIEDSEEEEAQLEPPTSENNVKSIIKKSSSEQKKSVKFGDGFLPRESSDVEDIASLKIIRKRRIKKTKASENTKIQKDSAAISKKLAESYENIPPPPPPDGQPDPNHQQPELKTIPQDLYASFPINPSPIYYYINKLRYHQSNGHQNVKAQVRSLNTSDPRLNMSSTTNCYNRFP